jgi:hypothetical protein
MKPRSVTPPVWLPFALLVGAAVYVVRYWISHQIKGPQAIGPIVLLAVGTLVCGLLEGFTKLNLMSVKGERDHGLEPEAAEQVAQVNRLIVRWVCLALAFSMSWGSVFGAGEQAGIHWSFAPVLLGTLGAAITYACLKLVRCLADLRARGLGRGLEGYNGVIYKNPSDSRLWVPKLGGVGYTINFAHPRAWGMMALLIFPNVLLVILLVYLR